MITLNISKENVFYEPRARELKINVSETCGCKTNPFWRLDQLIKPEGSINTRVTETLLIILPDNNHVSSFQRNVFFYFTISRSHICYIYIGSWAFSGKIQTNSLHQGQVLDTRILYFIRLVSWRMKCQILIHNSRSAMTFFKSFWYNKQLGVIH